MVRLRSVPSDHLFEIPAKLVERCALIKGQIDDGSAEEEIPLPDIDKKTFEKVLVYLEHVDAGNAAPEIEKPLRSNNLGDVTTEFYTNYMDLPDDEIENAILAANYLQCPGLLTLSCAKMGSIIRGLSIPEFRKRFNIVNDFTPEEEAEQFDEQKIAELAEQYQKQQEENAKKEQEEEKKSE